MPRQRSTKPKIPTLRARKSKNQVSAAASALYGEMMRKRAGKLLFNGKRIFPAPPAPPSPFQEKRETFLFDKVLIYVKYASRRICDKTQNAHLHRRMQCESRSCFAPEQRRECTTVHDRSSTEARHEIDHNAPSSEIFLHNKWDTILPARVGNRAY